MISLFRNPFSRSNVSRKPAEPPRAAEPKKTAAEPKPSNKTLARMQDGFEAPSRTERTRAMLGGDPAVTRTDKSGAAQPSTSAGQRPEVTQADKTGAKSPARTQAEQRYAQLAATTAGQRTLEELDLRSGSELQAFGESLEEESQAPDAELNPNNLITFATDPAEVARVIEAAADLVPEADRELLRTPEFQERVAGGEHPGQVKLELEARSLFEEQVASASNKQPEDWGAVDAANFHEALAEQVVANRENPELVRELLHLSSTQLERGAEILGRATEANDYNDQGVEDLAAAYSRIGTAAPEDAAAQLAVGLASKIDDDSELNKVDDGFKAYAESSGTDRFRGLVAEALNAQGKGDAAEELVQDQGGSSVTDRARQAVEALIDQVDGPAAALYDFRGEVVERVDGVRRAVVDRAVDAGTGALRTGGDVATGVAHAGLGLVERGSAYAREQGPAWLDPALNVVDTGARHGHQALDVNNRVRHHALDAVQSSGHAANGFVHDAVVDPVGTGEKVLDAGKTAAELLKLQEQVELLGKGDFFRIEATVAGAAFDVQGSIGGTLMMSQNEQGQYVLRAEGRLGAALASVSGATGGATGEASIGVGNSAAAEFTFDSPSDLVDAARAVLGPVGGAASALVEGDTGEAVDALLPDFGLLAENLSAVELGTDITGKLQGSLGADLAAGLSGNITGKLQYGARIEFPNGREGPPEVVLRGTAQLTAAGSAKLGGTASADVVGAQGTVIVEHRLPLPEGLGLGDVFSDPQGSAERLVETARNEATTSVELRGRVSGGPGVNGGAPGGATGVTQTSIKLTGDTGKIAGALPELFSGDYTGALAELEDVTVKASVTRGNETKLGAEFQGGDSVNSAKVNFSGTAYDQTQTVFTYEGTVEEGLGQLSRLPAYLANLRG
ncbi:hypothetical protein [Myxococcus qinghaiensis]|uniref:hypothetical protein n=1 Tax=Myxococcus qinghaiensis TaxID=2906758 RepID=UPI0020A7DE22|nr:hypothetical protein [Myxococcus qinghaiensis]MCP3162413.1 hypothetical protein [Myxococcus qinghaiensis]